ncbi:iron uptake porin [Nodularia chucula]|uniref:iron uptake porin n=1 Tax=Nodularia chucula TaxID=3093667 RepID=UPI0039C5F5F1
MLSNKIYLWVLMSVTLTLQLFLGQTAKASEITEVIDNQVNSEKTYLAQTGDNLNFGDDLAQVTSISQLSDVQPTDWAFQALQSLVERYGCIAGYPDATFRGNRALTRYEFAAGLNACLDRVNELIATATADMINRNDLTTLQRLQEEFSAELATLRGRVDALEARTAELEGNQFSTTTKLNAEGIFVVADIFGDERANGGDLNVNPILANRVRLNFDSSFTGRDRLRVRLQSGNISGFNSGLTGTNMTRLGFDANTGNNVEIDDFYYRFPVGRNTTAWLIANGFGSDNVVQSTFNTALQSGGTGSISRFGRYHSIYRMASGSGLAVNHKFSDSLALSLAYRAANANNPNEKAGLFDGQQAIQSQLTFQPSPNVGLGLTYVNYYAPSGAVNLTGSIGSGFASRPFATDSATLANAYGVQASYRFSPRFIVSGWGGYTNAQALAGSNEGSKADIWNWAVTLALPDFGKRGNLAGFVFGMPPKVTSNDVASRENEGTSYHIEGFYRYRVTDNVDVTPGVMVILNPEHNDNNDPLWVGVLRTRFSF